MTRLLRIPHGLLRRHLTKVERIIVAAGLTSLLYGLLTGLPVYPAYWDIAILAGVFVSALWLPGVAYLMAAAAAVYPLYSLSLYVAVLFLAVALLGQRLSTHNLGAIVLVLATPWLAQYRLAWVVPLFGGLWWGKIGGLWIGGLAALWGQLLGGMSGLSPDWLTLSGGLPTIEGIAQRFGEANSLETLLLILDPLAPNPILLLYHLLQVVAWAAIGGLVGGSADRAWTRQHRPQGAILLGTVGAIALVGIHLGLALWFKLPPAGTLAPLWGSLLSTIVLVAVLEWLRDYLEHPLPVRRKTYRLRRENVPELGYAPLPIPTEFPDDDPQKEIDNLIMLELD